MILVNQSFRWRTAPFQKFWVNTLRIKMKRTSTHEGQWTNSQMILVYKEPAFGKWWRMAHRKALPEKWERRALTEPFLMEPQWVMSQCIEYTEEGICSEFQKEKEKHFKMHLSIYLTPPFFFASSAMPVINKKSSLL